MRLRRPLPAVQGDTLHIVGVGDNRIGKPRTPGCEMPSLKPKCSCPLKGPGRVLPYCSKISLKLARSACSAISACNSCKSSHVSAARMTTISAELPAPPTTHFDGAAPGLVGSPRNDARLRNPSLNAISPNLLNSSPPTSLSIPEPEKATLTPTELRKTLAQPFLERDIAELAQLVPADQPLDPRTGKSHIDADRIEKNAPRTQTPPARPPKLSEGDHFSHRGNVRS